MTTIVWDGTHLAADRRSSGGILCTVHKILRGADGRLVGAAGGTSACQALIAWVAAGEVGDPPVPITSTDWAEMMMVDPQGTVWIYGDHGRFPIRDRWMAIGSGAKYAIAALACGKTAAEAIGIANLFDGDTGPDADVLELTAPAPRPPRSRGASRPRPSLT